MRKFYALLLLLVMASACTKQKCNDTAQMQLTVTPNTSYSFTLLKGGNLDRFMIVNTAGITTYNIDSVVFGNYRLYVQNMHRDSFDISVDKCVFKMDVRQ